jgi:hypothetical protein
MFKVRLEGVAKRLPERCFTASPVAFFMLLCYIDESGTPEIPGNTSHFVLAGLAIPISCWKKAEMDIMDIKRKYGLEIHTAWILRKYLEQTKIPGFDGMPKDQRIYEVTKYRNAELLRLQKVGRKAYMQTRKNYRETDYYIHLTHTERKAFIFDVAGKIAQWNFARLFAECIDKISYDPSKATSTIAEQAFEQIVSRFETYLEKREVREKTEQFGLLIHDNNETVAKKHTALMRKFHKSGTLAGAIPHIMETPFFVDSKLTSMVQLADLCAYALRRYLENGETDLFDLIVTHAEKNEDKYISIGL